MSESNTRALWSIPLIVMLLALLGVYATAGPIPGVVDPALELALRTELDCPIGWISEPDFARLERLELENTTHLAGIGRCVGLQALSLRHLDPMFYPLGIERDPTTSRPWHEYFEEISDTKYGYLQTQSLPPVSLAPIRQLKQLKSLKLEGQVAHQLSEVGRLPRLESLTLLTSCLPQASILDLRTVANYPSLTTLTVQGDYATLPDFSRLPALKEVELYPYPVAPPPGKRSTEYNSLWNSPSLTSLTLHDYQLNEWSPQGTPTALTSCFLFLGEFQTLDGLKSAKNLQHLSLYAPTCPSLEALRSLRKLETVRIGINSMHPDLAPLRDLPALRQLTVYLRPDTDYEELLAVCNSDRTHYLDVYCHEPPPTPARQRQLNTGRVRIKQIEYVCGSG